MSPRNCGPVAVHLSNSGARQQENNTNWGQRWSLLGFMEERLLLGEITGDTLPSARPTSPMFRRSPAAATRLRRWVWPRRFQTGSSRTERRLRPLKGLPSLAAPFFALAGTSASSRQGGILTWAPMPPRIVKVELDDDSFPVAERTVDPVFGFENVQPNNIHPAAPVPAGPPKANLLSLQLSRGGNSRRCIGCARQ
jgi:hypothetical protein